MSSTETTGPEGAPELFPRKQQAEPQSTEAALWDLLKCLTSKLGGEVHIERDEFNDVVWRHGLSLTMSQDKNTSILKLERL